MAGITTKRRRAKTSVLRQNQIMIHDYMRDRNLADVDLDEVAEWAVRNGHWARRPLDPVQQCKRDLSRAMRAEKYTDPQGREVRRMHPAIYQEKSGQLRVMWAELTRAKPGHMRLSLSQRRTSILGDCKQHRLDFESYNDNNVYQAKLPDFDYNFNTDLVESQLPTHYPTEKPED